MSVAGWSVWLACLALVPAGRALADPEKADVWGKFIVHSARATPGPLLVQLGILLKSPDAIILATAQIRGRTLVTRNSKDFQADMPGIRVPYVLG